MNEDIALLHRYNAAHDEEAFAELVRRNLPLVYGAAVRQLDGAAHRAEEVTQSVFTDLARKAAPLSRRTDIVGWLYTSTHFAAAKLKRAEQRRQQREQEAHTMRELLSDTSAVDWERLRPVLDDAMQQLGESEREAILQRFFQGRRFADMARQHGLSEDAARMRVERALERLRSLLAKRQITSTTTALAVALANQPAIAVPSGLVATVASTALAGAAAGLGSGVAWAEFFTMTKIKIGIVSAMVVAGLTTAIVELRAGQALNAEIQNLRAENQELSRLQAENQRLSVAMPNAAAGDPAAREQPQRRALTGQQAAQSARSAAAEMKPAAEWRNAGIATPEAAYETQLWARAHGDLDVLATTHAMGRITGPRVAAFFAAMTESARAHFGTPEKLSAHLHSFAPWNPDAKRPEIAAFRILAKDEAVALGMQGEGEGWVHVLTRDTAQANWVPDDHEGRTATKKTVVGASAKFTRTKEGWKVMHADPDWQWQKILDYFDPATGQPRGGKK